MPPAPTSELDICNLALLAIKETKISSIDNPKTTKEEDMALLYPQERRRLLREYIWNFSTKRDTLSRSGTPAFEYADSYTIPADCLRVRTINGLNAIDAGLINYQVEGDQLLMNNSGAASLKVIYSQDVISVKKFDPSFLQLLYLSLAQAAAYAFSAKPSILQMIEGRLTQAELKAVTVDGQENRPTRIQRSPIQARRRGVRSSQYGGPVIYFN